MNFSIRLMNALVAVSAIAFLCQATQAQAQAQAFALAGPIPGVSWAHEGLRLNYTWYAGYLPGQYVTWRQDEFGDWINTSTGQHMDRIEHNSTSANGIQQCDIVCIDRDTVVISSKMFNIDTIQGFKDPIGDDHQSSCTASVGSAEDPGIGWVAPQLLARLKTDSSAGRLVETIKWQSEGKIVDAIRVQKFNTDSYESTIYDRNTGLTLHVASASTGTNGDTRLTEDNFIGSRDLNIPWANEPLNSAVAHLSAIQLQGQQFSRDAILKGSFPIDLLMSVSKRGNGWMLMDQTLTLHPTPGVSPISSKWPIAYGRSQLCGMWIGPASAMQMREGQVLDEDPVTRMKTVVAKIDNTGILITCINSASGTKCRYDRATGLLNGMSVFEDIAKTEVAVLRVSVQ